ncbi:MAG: magnesium-dependent phosphatase-1 [Desulfurococcaceae archaeon]|nr:MAG: magnesium-dependent phosphatase-1 [Desulfurococcaceae archaeon]
MWRARVLGSFLLLMDLDGTMWDHKNVTDLTPPFKRVSETKVVDSRGVEVNLYPEALKILLWARSSGAYVSSLSWNDPEKALGVLKAFGISDLFHQHMIENHPNKDIMISKLLSMLKSRGIQYPLCRIVYIDDRTIHLDSIYRNIGRIVFLQAWKDFKTHLEAIEAIEKRLRECHD